MTTHKDQLFHLGGVPVNGPFILQTGKTIFVKPSSGNDDLDGSSIKKAVKTLVRALALATANNGDVVYLVAESNTASSTSDYQSATLDWNKDGVHLIGVNACSQLGQRSRIAQLSTATTVENLFVVSANNCLIANLEVFQGVASSTATAPVALTVSGQRNHVLNCQISGNGDTAQSMDTSGARSLVVSGAENLIENCYIGLNTSLRTTAAAEVSIGAAARNIFRNCHIDTYCSSTAFLLVTVAAGMDRFTLFDNCILTASANISSAAAPAGAIGGSIASINGYILLRNPCLAGITQITAADAPRVLALGHNGLATGHLIGLSQAIDAA